MPYYDDTKQTAQQRDETIADLRKRGLTYRDIAKKMGMNPGAVYNVLQRIKEGRPGRDPLP